MHLYSPHFANALLGLSFASLTRYSYSSFILSKAKNILNVVRDYLQHIHLSSFQSFGFSLERSERET